MPAAQSAHVHHEEPEEHEGQCHLQVAVCLAHKSAMKSLLHFMVTSAAVRRERLRLFCRPVL
jgi:hypothetical protein